MPFSPIPRPPFSNILTAYSSIVPNGWNVGTVATTSTSPVVSFSARMRLSSSARLEASMMPAKSLTVPVSAGGVA